MRAADALGAMRALPLAHDLDDILDGRTPLILAPHPDDESLGCGGLIAECCTRRGRHPFVAVLTDGTGSHPYSQEFPADRLRAVREEETRAATAALGLSPDRIAFMRERDTAAPTSGPAFDAAVSRLCRLCAEAGAGVLLAPWRHDPHCDHAAAHLIARAAAPRIGAIHLSYPVWGWTLADGQEVEGGPPRGWRLDIARRLPAKRRAIRAYRSQHGGLVTDDPSGFSLPTGFLTLFDQPYETFLLPDQGASQDAVSG